MLKVYGRATSDNVQKVLWMVAETGQPFEHIPLGGDFGGLDDPEYLALNPHGRIPTLDDDGVVVWESNAIVRYLSAVYCRGTRWPEDAVDRALADQWMSWAQTTLYGHFNRLFWLTVRTPDKDQSPDKIQSTYERLIGCYRLLDAQLSKHGYVAAEHMTMADIPTGSTLYRYFNMPIERPELPNLERWYGLLCERDAYRKWVMVSFEHLWGRLRY
ncbi:MAG: glutathione S-transferase [Gammaproteobacteria bacterium]|nr:MAG: glutathione S-transferase [Gammaproteobacteria bacterium]